MRGWSAGLVLALAGLVTGSSVVAGACTARAPELPAQINACAGAPRLRIAAAGDVLLHSPLQRSGYAAAEGPAALWAAAAPIFRAADIAYVNLEGPVAPGVTRSRRLVGDPGQLFDNVVYTSYPMFNYHPSVIDGLKEAGIDIVSTANNHSMDRGSVGADTTIDMLAARRMPFTGTIKRDSARNFVAHMPSALGRTAWIACSYSTNGLADPGRQVLMCYDDRDELLSIVAAQAARLDVAAVIVTPHWGYEYNHAANARQKDLGRALIAAGATAVIGTHAHVVQPWEVVTTENGRRGLVVYGTGNFVSGQRNLPRRSSILAWIEMCRPMPSGDLARDLSAGLVVSNAAWVPLWMEWGGQGPRLQISPSGATGLRGSALALTRRILPAAQEWRGAAEAAACAASSPAASEPFFEGVEIALQ